MPHFVYEDTALFYPKTDLSPIPAGGDTTQYVQALDWNTLNQAVVDIKGVLRGAVQLGFTPQSTDPAPTGIDDYLWLDTSDDLFMHTGGQPGTNTNLSTVGGGSVNSASNVNVGGVGVFKQLNVADLEFKGAKAGSSKVSIADSVGTNTFDIDVVEVNVLHQNLGGAGTIAHAAIDSQLPSADQKTDLGQLDGASRGTVWYSNVSGRVNRLAPGTAKQFLMTQGVGNDPVWADGHLTVQDEGTPATNTPHPILNFIGANVTASDAGGGVLAVNIGGALASHTHLAADLTLSLDDAYNDGSIIAVDAGPIVPTVDALGAVSTDAAIALLLANTTDAAVGAQQFSPLLVLEGQGWKTDATAETQELQFAFQTQPIEGAAIITGELHFLVNVNDAGFVSLMDLSSAGELTLLAGLVLGSGVSIASAGDVAFSVADLDLQANVTTLDIKGGTDLSVDGAALTTGLTAALLSEALLFFTNTDITGAEAETLTDGSNADALHAHAALAATSADISIVTTTGGDVDITAAGGVDINGATIGIFGTTSVAQQVSGADLTNNVTSGGTSDVIDDFTDLSTYATDAAAIRNAIYQLTRKLKQVNDGMRAYGWLT